MELTAIPPAQAARLLGISRSKVYTLAAPEGPIPCVRIGRRVIFEMSDLMEYREKCRSIETKATVVSSLNSTARLKTSVSELESVFQKLGVKPKRTPSIARSQRDSTASRPALSVIGTP
ncbi:DNA-binding protein [Allopusillimonas ginsengisoli]|nr:DNA-binding protein [Allopusillimonas ginsengisoli]